MEDITLTDEQRVTLIDRVRTYSASERERLGEAHEALVQWDELADIVAQEGPLPLDPVTTHRLHEVADRCRLARSIRPEKPEHGSARHREIDAIDGYLRAELLREPAGLYRELSCRVAQGRGGHRRRSARGLSGIDQQRGRDGSREHPTIVGDQYRQQ